MKTHAKYQAWILPTCNSQQSKNSRQQCKKNCCVRIAAMKSSSQYKLLHPVLSSYERALANGHGTQWISNCFEIKEQQKHHSLILPSCGVVSRTFFIALVGMHNKITKRTMTAAKKMAVIKFQKKASNKRKKEKEKRIKKTLNTSAASSC